MARPRRLSLDIQEPERSFSVYRAVRTDDPNDAATLERGFQSSAARGLPPRPGSVQVSTPFIYNGVSAYDSRKAALEHARARRDIGKPIGTHVAEIVLQPGGDFEYAYWGDDGHLTVVADAVKLREAVADIVPI